MQLGPFAEKGELQVLNSSCACAIPRLVCRGQELKPGAELSPGDVAELTLKVGPIYRAGLLAQWVEVVIRSPSDGRLTRHRIRCEGKVSSSESAVHAAKLQWTVRLPAPEDFKRLTFRRPVSCVELLEVPGSLALALDETSGVKDQSTLVTLLRGGPFRQTGLYSAVLRAKLRDGVWQQVPLALRVAAVESIWPESKVIRLRCDSERAFEFEYRAPYVGLPAEIHYAVLVGANAARARGGSQSLVSAVCEATEGLEGSKRGARLTLRLRAHSNQGVERAELRVRPSPGTEYVVAAKLLVSVRG